MKCGIMTFHRAINYGAVLQAYALRNVIESDFKVKCEIIDYRCKSIESMYTNPFFLKGLKAKIRGLLLLPKRIKFNNFLNKKLLIGKSIQKNDLEKCSQNYDYIITGSDQVWGKRRLGVDHSYFLDFVKDNNKKISYAASMGGGTIEKEYQQQYINLLQSFRHISVREYEVKEMLENMLQKPVEVCLDPTLLLDKEQWRGIAKGRVPKRKYLLIYTMTESGSLIKHARKVANQKKLDIYYISDSFHTYKGIKNLRAVGPEEWINLFMNASYVVTNSFHGTAFAINFNCDFNSEISKGISNRGARITDLLKSVGLSNRLINNVEDTQPIDFKRCNSILEKMRNESKAYLEKIFNEEK